MTARSERSKFWGRQFEGAVWACMGYMHIKGTIGQRKVLISSNTVSRRALSFYDLGVRVPGAIVGVCCHA